MISLPLKDASFNVFIFEVAGTRKCATIVNISLLLILIHSTVEVLLGFVNNVAVTKPLLFIKGLKFSHLV